MLGKKGGQERVCFSPPGPHAARCWWSGVRISSCLRDAAEGNTSQNHRVVWVGRDLKDHLVPPPLQWAGTSSTRPVCCSNAQPTTQQQLAELGEKDDESVTHPATPSSRQGRASLPHNHLTLLGSHPSHLSRNGPSWSYGTMRSSGLWYKLDCAGQQFSSCFVPSTPFLMERSCDWRAWQNNFRPSLSISSVLNTLLLHRGKYSGKSCYRSLTLRDR